MKNKILGFVAVVSFVITVSVIGTFVYYIKTSKTAYIDVNKLYTAYSQKAELEKQFEGEQVKQNSMLDSLKLELTLLGNRIKTKSAGGDKEVYEKTLQYYNYLEQEFARINETKSKIYKEQILGQLNQYVSEYGMDKGYKYIYGANGNGSLMFASKDQEITDEVIKYVNQKYHGK